MNERQLQEPSARLVNDRDWSLPARRLFIPFPVGLVSGSWIAPRASARLALVESGRQVLHHLDDPIAPGPFQCIGAFRQRSLQVDFRTAPPSILITPAPS
jgi:hypothetical protein